MPQYRQMADDRTCPNCHGLVTAGEEFCPTCGEWLGIEGGETPERFELGADGLERPTGAPEPSPAPVTTPAPPRAEGTAIRCPLCGRDNPPNNRHCEQCGARLANGQLPVAPQPMVQTTAAMRTAIIAGSVLVLVVVVAFVVNAFRGDGEDPAVADSSTSTTTSSVASQQVVVDSVECSAEYATAHPCTNLIDGTPADWNAPIPPPGETLTITMQFDRPYAISFVEIQNLPEDDERFLLNYRVRAVRLSTSDVATPFSKSLPDQPGALLEPIEFRTTNSVSLTIEIVSTYPSQSIGEGEDIQPGFQDLSVAEIRVFGTPAA